MRIFISAFLAVACWGASDRIAAHLASEAKAAQASDQIVKAYLLYAEAAARDPSNFSYRSNRDALAPVAHLLTKANIQSADISSDIAEAENPSGKDEKTPPITFATPAEIEQARSPQPLPHIKASSGSHAFDLHTDEKSLFNQVTAAYGVRVMFDPDLHPRANIPFSVSPVNFKTAMEELTAATNTFVFPISPHTLFVARDTAVKRNELEPEIYLTVDLPQAIDQKDLIEAASAVRGILRMQTMAFDTGNRQVIIRDQAARAHVAQSLLEALLLPRAQLSIDVQILTVTSDRKYHYGLSMPTSFSLAALGHIGNFQSVLPTFNNAINFLSFGGGATFFGLGLTNATAFATYSNAFASVLYDAKVVTGDGQTANLHIGDKYPIPQSVYSGFQQTNSSIYNPIGQVSLEDLGLILKLTPHIDGEGDISLDIEAAYKTLGAEIYDTIPAINERDYKGAVRMKENEWAVIAGMEATDHSVTRTGLIGLSSIPGLNQVLAENTREDTHDQTLLIIKPVITRLPMAASISPQYLVGSLSGPRVLL